MAWNRVDDGEQYEAARRLNAEAGRTWTVMWAPGLRAYVAFYQGTAAVRWQGSPTAEGLMERLREAERGLRAGPGGSRTPERGDGPRAGGAHRRREAAPVPAAAGATTAAVPAPAGPAAVSGPDAVTGSWAPPHTAGVGDPVEGAGPDGSVRAPVPGVVPAGSEPRLFGGVVADTPDSVEGAGLDGFVGEPAPDAVRAGFDPRVSDGPGAGAGRNRASRMPVEPDPGPESARAQAAGVDAHGPATPGGGEGAVAVDGPGTGRGSGAVPPCAGRHAAVPTVPVAADAGPARSRAPMRRPAPVPVPVPAAVPDGGADHAIETAPGTARATFVPVGAGTGTGPWSATTRLRGPRPGARAVVIPGEPVADGYWTCPAQGCSWTSINPMSHPCPVGGQSRARGRGHGRSPARARGEFGVEGALRAGPAS
ncbi:hypothetical protein SAMN05421803_13710 [Nocardiopsis flavescens]|uniref:Uncharacterized protein n=1 Tax=Nocardiopsis flavescens TaxID=758803 RepID=A0A1M6VST2_9ACTN|nr:hypothetical protein [Nocardiopsis flavescens]SHK84593.1 hypothetical protein SAMN05421803_13710 [Nocardiopsis flavescens]